MEIATIDALALAAAAATACGLRAFFAIAVIGIAARVGWMDVGNDWQALTSTPVIGTALALTAVEFLADKTPGMDSIWDQLAVLARVPAGSYLAASLGSVALPDHAFGLATAGASIAGVVHLGKSGTRALVNLSPEPLSNWLLSLMEDVAAPVLLVLAILVPLVLLVIVACLLGLILWLLPRLLRALRGAYQRIFRRSAAP